MHSTKRAHMYMFLLSLFMLAGQIVISIYLNESEATLSLTQSSIISQYGLILLPGVIYIFVTKTKVVDILHLKKVPVADLLYSIGIAIFIIPLMTFINIISQLFAYNYIQDYMDEILNMPYLLLIFIIAVTPALIEEITFRGIILRNYQHQTVLSACIVNGLLFGFFHGNLNQFFYAFMLGIVFAYVMHLTGSIIPAMLMHFTINASNVTYQRVVTKLYEVLAETNPQFAVDTSATLSTSDILIAAGIIFVVVLFTLPIALLLLHFLGKRNGKQHIIKDKAISGVVLGDLTIDEVDRNEKVFNPMFFIMMAYFVGYIILIEFVMPALT